MISSRESREEPREDPRDVVRPHDASAKPRLSIVIPMMNEAGNIPALFARLVPVLDGIGERYEIVAIDDGSSDATRARLDELQGSGVELKILSFARNFGQHSAVMAGFRAARGDWIVTIDADLQNPPEEIPKLVDAFRAGHDVVHTYRVGRQDSLFRTMASRMINRVMRRFSGITLRDFGCMLRGYHRRIVEPMTERPEFHTFIPALATLYARNPVEIPVAHAPRTVGRSNYSLIKLFTLQLDLVASFSLVPLRLLFSLGAMIASLGILFGVFLLVMRFVQGAAWAEHGVFTLFAILFIFVGAQFVAFGLLGEYIGRIYAEVRHRPTFVVREEVAPRAKEIASDAARAAPSPAASASSSVRAPR